MTKAKKFNYQCFYMISALDESFELVTLNQILALKRAMRISSHSGE